MDLCFLCLNVFVGPKFFNLIQVEIVKVLFVDISKCMEQYEIILHFYNCGNMFLLVRCCKILHICLSVLSHSSYLVISLGEVQEGQGSKPHTCGRNEARRRGDPLEQEKGEFQLQYTSKFPIKV